MTHLSDTDRVVDYLAGRSQAVQLLDSLADTGLAVSVLTIYEVIEGIQSSRDPAQDILIAATAIHHDLTLVTRNRRHYGRIPHLKIFREQETA